MYFNHLGPLPNLTAAAKLRTKNWMISPVEFAYFREILA